MKILLCLVLGLALCCAKDQRKTKEVEDVESTTTEAQPDGRSLDDDDIEVVVAADDNDDVEVVERAKSGRALIIDGVPVDNTNGNEAGFKLLRPEDIDTEKKDGIVTIVDNVPIDISESGKAGFRLPVLANETGSAEPRVPVIEVLILEEDDEFAPTFRELNSTESVEEYDDIIIIEVSAPSVDCFEEKDPGNCSEIIESFYYDQETSECQFFIYSGCGGNSNRFTTKVDCESHCKEKDEKKRLCTRSAPVCDKGCSLTKGDPCLECDCAKGDRSACSAPLATHGHCKASIPQWTYNSQTNTCQMFTYGGCEAGTSKNHFKTKQLCEATCVN